MTKQEVVDFLSDGFTLANLPDSFIHLRRIANDPHSDIEDVVAVARKDPELAASLLRLANSSVYNNGESVGSIEEAAQLLGMRTVVQCSLALGILKKVTVPDGSFDLQSFWRRSLTVATLAEAVYEHAPKLIKTIVDPKLLYTAGLLHDIGLLAMIQGFRDEMVRVIDRAISSETPIHLVEEEAFGFSHQDTGRILFKKWNLPEELQCVAGYHHHPLGLKRRLYYPLVDIVYVADYICCAGGPEMPAAFRPALLEDVWNRSRLDVNLIGTFSGELDQASDSAEAILSC
ncbi:HDOD domain-containing protein [Pelagicoccus mobilis]|uniref:HDOD domain-containing protein n=1 Tax=Pelagicoccus mobilis TaxID=415221 RepID=A0A934S4E7_9BACT|nr:HDOD domain-containing protein [Pelagicoccus mobilis]MBK1880546.1 HDOD domain-containing protein [Pelagicoccus mobilis]